MTNNAYAKNNGDGLLCSILCLWCKSCTRVILCHILASKYLDFTLNWLSCFHHSTCDIIPKLSINMETYPYLVSSQIPHILLYKFIQYKNNHCV